MPGAHFFQLISTRFVLSLSPPLTGSLPVTNPYPNPSLWPNGYRAVFAWTAEGPGFES